MPEKPLLVATSQPTRPLAAALLLVAVAACGHVSPAAYVDRRMGEALPASTSAGGVGEAAAHLGPFDASAPPGGAAREGPRLEGAVGSAATPLRLADLLDLALSRDPATRAAWHEARAAAATVGSRRAAYLPTITAAGLLQDQSTSLTAEEPPHTLFGGASAELTWLLLDLGTRGARQEGAELDLRAARLAHQAAALDLTLSVEVAWFQFQTARALAGAAAVTVKQAEASREAAEARRRAGAATLADVLQARTALSQARLEAQRLEGQVLALRGALATLVGLPPTTALEVVPLPETLPADLALPEVERLLEEAGQRNPELARARAEAAAADARARAAATADLPTLSLGGTLGSAWPLDPSSPAIETWSAGLILTVPITDGRRARFDAEAARQAAQAAEARAEQATRRAGLDVWTSLQALRTSGQRIETSRDLLASATSGLEVVGARYREGVGSILDLLSAQNALAGARAEEILARADWLVAVARLARATGRALPATDGAPR
jgi:outer membrane protein